MKKLALFMTVFTLLGCGGGGGGGSATNYTDGPGKGGGGDFKDTSVPLDNLLANRWTEYDFTEIEINGSQRQITIAGKVEVQTYASYSGARIDNVTLIFKMLDAPTDAMDAVIWLSEGNIQCEIENPSDIRQREELDNAPAALSLAREKNVNTAWSARSKMFGTQFTVPKYRFAKVILSGISAQTRIDFAFNRYKRPQ